MIIKNFTLVKVLLVFFFLSYNYANSRVAFSRPGNMVKIPGIAYDKESTFLFSVNSGGEIVNVSNTFRRYTSSVSINFQNRSGFNLGFSAASLADPVGMNEAGFHIQKTIFKYGSVTISAGLHDVLYRRDGNDIIRINDMSFFTVFTSYKEFDNYSLEINFGGGTGKVDYDPQTDYLSEDQTAGVFMGFNLNTPYLKGNGGVDLILEYDGRGANLGFEIPVTKNYLMNFGITRIDNLGEFGTESREGKERKDLQADAPAISINFTMNIPNLFNEKQSELTDMPYNINQDFPSTAIGDTEDKEMGELIFTLRDSVRISLNEVENLSDQNLFLKQKLAILMDSTRVYYLEKQIDQANINTIMRHVSRSLRYFYNGEYRESLSEIDKAIEINPNIALAYARRGSIYYKLGDFQRATMNWNIALKLDPKFTEIQELLRASKDSRLSSAELKN